MDGIIPAVARNSWNEALSRTRKTTFGRISTLFGATELTDIFWEDLEASLIQADLGVDLTLELISDLQDRARKEGWTDGAEVHVATRTTLLDLVTSSNSELPQGHPYTVVLVGVNGSGKTTTAARLAYRELQNKHSVILASADTYRAAACEQLKVWGERISVDVICGQPGSDPGAVVYDAGQAAIARDLDALIVDTSGRMHTEHNLMAELQKIVKVLGKVIDGAPHLTLLILDATTGQNGLAQAEAFTKTIQIDGVVLAKLDGSAKGGIALAIRKKLNLPIYYVGLGEGIGDLVRFDPQAYVDGLLAPTSSMG